MNLHYYENALLETTRLSECLSMNARVVSEDAADSDESAGFDGRVRFFPPGDAAAMVQQVQAALDADLPDADWSAQFERTRFMLWRLLLGLGVIDFAAFHAETMRYPIGPNLALALPEDVVRHAYCRANLRPGVHTFPGLKARPPWVGCALSYRYLAQRALDAGLPELLVHEDDASFSPDFDARQAAIRQHLARHAGQWDIFSGLLSHITPETRVLDVQEVDGITFVTVDRVIGMVYGIYAPKAQQVIASWRKTSDHYMHATVDRVLERNGTLRVLTTLPFLVGHQVEMFSTLWTAHNREAAQMIDDSQTLLAEKVARFRAQQRA